MTRLSSAVYYRFQYFRLLFHNCVPLACMPAIARSSHSESVDCHCCLIVRSLRQLCFYLYCVCITNMAYILISVSNYLDGQCIETISIALKSITK